MLIIISDTQRTDSICIFADFCLGFECNDDGECLPESKRCDGTFDCPHGEDDAFCSRCHEIPLNYVFHLENNIGKHGLYDKKLERASNLVSSFVQLCEAQIRWATKFMYKCNMRRED